MSMELFLEVIQVMRHIRELWELERKRLRMWREAWYFRRRVMCQFFLGIFDAWVGLCPGLVENRSVDSEDGNPWQDLV